MNPWLLRLPLGDVQVVVSAYFASLMLGLLLAMEVSIREARRSGEPPLLILRIAVPAILAGLVGGRLGHVLLVNPGRYLEKPTAVLQFWEGGMVLYGGLILAVLCAVLLIRRAGASLPRMCDIMAPAVVVGIAGGRLGCLSAGCCYGKPIDWGTGIEWPWGIAFLSGQVPSSLKGVPLHPTQAYAAFGAIGLFLVLTTLRRHQRYDGQVVGALFVGYALLRSLVEVFRFDLKRGFVFEDSWGHALSTSQALSIPVFLLGLALLIGFRRLAREEGTYGMLPREAAQFRRLEALSP